MVPAATLVLGWLVMEKSDEPKTSTVVEPTLWPDTSIGAGDRVIVVVPEFWITKVWVTVSPTFSEPKSVPSVVEGEASVSKISTPLPVRLTSTPPVPVAVIAKLKGFSSASSFVMFTTAERAPTRDGV